MYTWRALGDTRGLMFAAWPRICDPGGPNVRTHAIARRRMAAASAKERLHRPSAPFLTNLLRHHFEQIDTARVFTSSDGTYLRR